MKMLDESQRKRLQEISIQQNGPRSLHDADVVAELGLSDEQKAEAHGGRRREQQGLRKGVPRSRAARTGGERAGELAEKPTSGCWACSPTSRKRRSKQMKGEEFDVDLSPLFRRGRGPR